MKTLDQRTLKLLTFLALLASSVPITITVLWFKAFNLGSTQAERVAIFYTYLPEFLHGRWNATYLSILFCIFAIILSAKSMGSPGRWLRALNILILAVSCGLLCLNLFSMM